MAEAGSGARDALNSVTRGTLILFIGTLAFVGLNFVLRVILARSLTVTEFGDYSVGLSLAGLLISFGNLALPQAVARNIPYVATDDERRGVIRAGFLFVLPMAAAVAGLMLVVAYLLDVRYNAPALGEAVAIFAPAVAGSIIGTQIASVFQGLEDVRPNALFIQLLNPALVIGFLVVAALLPYGTSTNVGPIHLTYANALYAYLAANAITVLGLVIYYWRRLPKRLVHGPSAPGMSRHILLFAAPLLAVAVLAYVDGNADTLILNYFHSGSVGPYVAALTMARLLQVGLSALGYILLPVIARYARVDDTATTKTTYVTATKWTLLTSLPLFLVFFALPTISLDLVYGAAYAGPAVPLQILILGSMIAVLVGPASATQVAFGQTRALLYNTMAAALADVLLALWLVPTYGSLGAAIAWGTAAALAPTLSMIQLGLTKGVHPFERHYVVPLVLTAVPVGLALTLLHGTGPLWLLPLLVLASAGAFIGVIVLTRSIDEGDRMLLGAVEGLLHFRLPLVRRFGRWLDTGRP
ncbi:MAG: oligosaccharide flippase family protein [Thermoplasmata archaeon]|nr:oligosaccharide flippase family protein [Thermoplasmata archaeon]